MMTRIEVQSALLVASGFDSPHDWHDRGSQMWLLCERERDRLNRKLQTDLRKASIHHLSERLLSLPNFPANSLDREIFLTLRPSSDLPIGRGNLTFQYIALPRLQLFRVQQSNECWSPKPISSWICCTTALTAY
ncbi:hypothetical protein PHSY_001028 [Pseudozyma hubeiensis SY62]|uniref:Uncharacterized protein n=1 Tax=Pseudozyma hubeiensis (strain SY62) TaxID=1305764 RepID=R9NXL8_PSEHS|nr:hypothetical protein PHSY_001028 [Pseudozyma hubeiensis SY62]GAC93463.1 hypothetical protein PHSY_001028 [Pseudozyma hubeiensis SY62]